MIKNYFKTAYRSLVRGKFFTVINIAGLSLGIACSLLILLWVKDEKSVDAFHANSKSLYQVYERQYYDGKVEASYPTQGLLAQEMKKVIPDVKYSSSLDYAAAPGTQSTLEANGKINKHSGAFAGEDFFKMFSYPLLEGSTAAALRDANTIAISRSMAEIFFGNAASAINKTIRFENKTDLKITGVYENMPANSSIQFDFFRTWVDYVKENEWVKNWGNTSPSTFVQLQPNADAAAVQAKMKDFIYRYQQKDKSFTVELDLQPYAEKYLHSNFKNGQLDGGRIEYVNMFTLVAIFILLIACINFMNLATARAAARAKEVGVRKVIGAAKISLIGQFICEALLITLLSAIISVLLVVLILPLFNGITGKQITIPFAESSTWIYFFILILVTGLVAGSYPAFYLSSLKPIKVLKGIFQFSGSVTFLRKGLVVFQFALSIILIVGMVVIYRQLDFIQHKNLGYDRDNLVYLPIEGDLIKNYTAFKNEAVRLPSVTSVSKMRNTPTVIEHHNSSISWPGKGPDVTVSFADAVTGYDFVKTMKLQLKEGRDFSKEFNDSTSYMINETAAQRMGFKNAVGKTVSWGNRPGTIVGVIKDFHTNSIHAAIEPLIVRLDENWGWGTILVRVKAGQTKEAIAGLQKICSELNPKTPFTYQFSDEEFNKLYRSEELVSKLATAFAMLAILISCMGLFGLAAFVANQHKKEIGIRKVLGAGTVGIAALLSMDFLKLVLIAVVMASPVAWWALNNWLQNFAYHINVSWWIFIVAAVAAVMIALFTVSFQAIKAAVANPVRSLRTE